MPHTFPHGLEGNGVLGDVGRVIQRCWYSWMLYSTDRCCCQLYCLLAELWCCHGQAQPAGRGDASVTTSLSSSLLKWGRSCGLSMAQHASRESGEMPPSQRSWEGPLLLSERLLQTQFPESHSVLSTECSFWIIPPEMLAAILSKTQTVKVISKAQVCFVFVNANTWVSQIHIKVLIAYTKFLVC